MVFLVETGKNKHHHRILHIRISLDTEFQLKLTILIFGPNLLSKGISVQKRKIAVLRAPMVVAYYIKLSWTEADRYNGILMSLLLLVAETIIFDIPHFSF